MDLEADFVALAAYDGSGSSKPLGSTFSEQSRCVTDPSSPIGLYEDHQAPGSLAVVDSCGLGNTASDPSAFDLEPGIINPDRVRFIGSNLVDEIDRDLIDPPVPVTKHHEKTGANDLPLGVRKLRGLFGSSVENATLKRSATENQEQPPSRATELCHSEWDFNSTQPLPWQPPTALHPPRAVRASRSQAVQPRQFSDCKDNDLLDYLYRRRVSRGFLHEIDQFLRANPDIATYSPSFIETLNEYTPLSAYLFFVKGYTRPARYWDGLISSAPFVLPTDFRYRPIENAKDPELDDFFSGFEYRYDVLARIDREVYYAIIDLQAGRSVPSGLRRLVCYAIDGNPVDAYKWYEYNYQQEYMPHRYIPEHVVIADIPKPDDWAEPVPSVLQRWEKHADVRFRMARAKDEGLDVVDVLLSEFKFALIRKGLRRCDIDNLYTEARRRIDEERNYPTNTDIVDMIMDDALTKGYKPKPFNETSRRTKGPYYNVHATFTTGRSSKGRQQRWSTQARQVRDVKDVLVRLYSQEEIALAKGIRREELAAIQKSRATAERRYINALVQYKRDTKQMLRHEASDLQMRFTRKKMQNSGLENKTFLLSLYPKELY